MKVSRSGYSSWRGRKPTKRDEAKRSLMEHIKRVFTESDGTYGSPSIHRELRAGGIVCSEKRVAYLMRSAHLKATPVKRFVVTTDSDHPLPVAENLLNREFVSEMPNHRWVSDITYIWTSEGWLYLAVVLDLFSRRVVGWSMSRTMERSLVISALEMAVSRRHPRMGLLCHSDRGSQYASHDYQQALSQAGIVCSMSRKGNCWDNAPMESFFASLKRELVHRARFRSRAEAMSAVFRWIEVWYNRKRRHSSLGYLSPEAFEQKYQLQIQASVA